MCSNMARSLTQTTKSKTLTLDKQHGISVLASLHALLPVICRTKDLPNVLCRFQGRELRLSGLYSALKKRPS